MFTKKLVISSTGRELHKYLQAASMPTSLTIRFKVHNYRRLISGRGFQHTKISAHANVHIIVTVMLYPFFLKFLAMQKYCLYVALVECELLLSIRHILPDK